jgi:hypothetical protein
VCNPVCNRPDHTGARPGTAWHNVARVPARLRAPANGQAGAGATRHVGPRSHEVPRPAPLAAAVHAGTWAIVGVQDRTRENLRSLLAWTALGTAARQALERAWPPES